jgi:hypothetical protein
MRRNSLINSGKNAALVGIIPKEVKENSGQSPQNSTKPNATQSSPKASLLSSNSKPQIEVVQVSKKENNKPPAEVPQPTKKDVPVSTKEKAGKGDYYYYYYFTLNLISITCISFRTRW